MAPTRLLWFYRAGLLPDTAAVFLSPAPAEGDAALWRGAVEAVAAQRARWREGSECGGVVAFIAVDAAGRQATGGVVATPRGTAGSDRAAAAALLPRAWAAVARSAPTGTVPCSSVWCAWCEGGTVVAAGRAYGGTPRALAVPGLVFDEATPGMLVLPRDQRDADAIRARLDAAAGCLRGGDEPRAVAVSLPSCPEGRRFEP